jgi:O-antigen/teichoic acid export membrane protein
MLSSLIFMDKAVSRTLLLRAWGFVPGALSAFLVPLYLATSEQGYYYSFSSIIALQVFFELGLTQVLVFRFASMHKESASGSDSDPAKITSLLFASRIVYRFLGISFFLVALASGFLFFNMHPSLGVAWQGPWILLVVSTSVNLVQSVKLTYLEAIGSLHHVSIARLRSSVFASVCFLLVLTWGGRLWAACAFPFCNSVILTLWLYLHERAAPYRLARLARQSSSRFLWRMWLADVFPMQWKISISWISGYLIFQLYTPLVFQYLGSVEAGKLGYVISLTSSLLMVATTFTSALAPKLSSLYSCRDYASLNSVFNRSLVQSTIALLVLLALMPAALYALSVVDKDIAGRFLSPSDSLLYVISALFSGLSYVFSIYLRAQQHEPLLLVSMVTSVVMVPVLMIGLSYSLTCMLWGSSCVSALSFGWVLLVFMQNQRFLQKGSSA